jgi:hypothetical protein
MLDIKNELDLVTHICLSLNKSVEIQYKESEIEVAISGSDTIFKFDNGGRYKGKVEFIER